MNQNVYNLFLLIHNLINDCETSLILLTVHSTFSVIFAKHHNDLVSKIRYANYSVNYVFLDLEERDRFATSPIIESIGELSSFISLTSQTLSCLSN